MLQYLESIFGSITNNELAVVALIVIAILLFSWAPRLGEALGGMLTDDDPADPSDG